MWMYAIWCVSAVFNGCQGIMYTETSPLIPYANFKDQFECREKAAIHAKEVKFKNPDKNIVWKCIDYSNVEVKEVK